MALTLDAPEGTRGNNSKPSRLKRVQPPCVKQAAGSARREEPGGHTGKAQQVSSKVTPMSNVPERRQGQNACLLQHVAYIDTAEHPRGCGGQQS
jgi:hypothetical protein